LDVASYVPTKLHSQTITPIADVQNNIAEVGISQQIRIEVRSISNIRIVNQPEAGEPLIILANIMPLSAPIRYAKVLYTLNFSTAIHEVDMVLQAPIGEDDNIWRAEIQGYSSGTIINISIWAIDENNCISTSNIDDNGEPVRFVFPIRTSEAILRIQPRAYDIFNGDRIEIGVFAKEGDIITMRIYNSEGKLMATPINNIASDSDGINFFHWNGRDSEFHLVEPGLYICHIEVLDRTTGNKKTDVAPIVIGTRLRR